MRIRERVLDVLTLVTAACAVAVTIVVVRQQVRGRPSVAGAAATSPRKNRTVADANQMLAAGRRLGPEEAPLTILYFGDFECPACKHFSTTLSAFRKDHPNDVSVVFRHFPLEYHRFAYPSARAAECAADQGQFEEMYEVLYGAQDSLGLLTFQELARRANVPDLAQFTKCNAMTSRVPRIEQDLAAGTSIRLPGTPGVIINGTLYEERLPTQAVLDSLLRDARIGTR